MTFYLAAFRYWLWRYYGRDFWPAERPDIFAKDD